MSSSTDNSALIFSQKKPSKMVSTPSVYRKRISRYRQCNILFSRFIDYPNKRGIKAKVYSACKKIWECYFQDDLKSPQGNPAVPASITKPSMNFYFGINLEVHDETIVRTAYGVGSGTSSIGLNPRTLKIHSAFTELVHLMAWATALVKMDKDWMWVMWQKSFNFCSVKIYYAFKDAKGKIVQKDTQWHVDVTQDKNGNPLKNNSQEPGTPVAILTFGETKNLMFRRHLSKHVFDKHTTCLFQQRNASLFILDYRDERVSRKDGLHWRHMSEMQPNTEGITFSFMFRVVKKTVAINKSDSTFVDPRVGDKKAIQFQQGQCLFHTDHYKHEQCELQKKMEAFFDKYKLK